MTKKSKMIDSGSFVVDENSMAMKIIRGCDFFGPVLSDIDGKYDYELHAKKHNMTLKRYVDLYRRDYGKTADKTYQIEASLFATANLRLWMKYQMTYVIRKSDLQGYLRRYPIFEPDMGEIKLPFPAVMVIMDLDDPEDAGHSVSFLICKREDRFDVVSIVDGVPYYSPADNRTFESLRGSKISEYIQDQHQRYYAYLSWLSIVFLAAYNHDRKALNTRRVILKGKNGIKAESSEYYFDGFSQNEKIVITSRENDGISAPRSSLLDTGSIPPDERPEEIVMQKGTHKSPEKHQVSGHYRRYWVGKGRKELRINYIEPFDRGGKPGDKMVPKAKVYK